jgi:hypothetical protein
MGFNFGNHGLKGIYQYPVRHQKSHRFLEFPGAKFSFWAKKDMRSFTLYQS